MEQKIFELMEKMYGEMQKGFTEVNKRLGKLEEGQDKLGNQVAKIENDLKPKIEVALDGYKVVYEKLENLENKVDQLAKTVEGHDVKIEAIKRAK